MVSSHLQTNKSSNRTHFAEMELKPEDVWFWIAVVAGVHLLVLVFWLISVCCSKPKSQAELFQCVPPAHSSTFSSCSPQCIISQSEMGLHHTAHPPELIGHAWWNMLA
jgi:hypothetical protein